MLSLKEFKNLRRKTLDLKHFLTKIEYASFESKACETSHVGTTAVSTCQFTLQEKVTLFQSLFQGREDVFAKRWYSNVTQKSGYQPVCKREWNREFCDKRKYRCAVSYVLELNDVYCTAGGVLLWHVIFDSSVQSENTSSAICLSPVPKEISLAVVNLSVANRHC